MKATNNMSNNTYKTGNSSDQQPTTALKLGEKYCLTVEEAAAYFEIGPKKIRRIAEDHPDDGIFIRNGVKLLVIRPKFEEFLTKSEEI